MAKQFIRHLEFYGFPDQNGYVSNIGNMDVDLSELKNKDKEHDKEIKCLENEKADKKDLLELSATVENFINTQSQINSAVVEELSGITSDIEKLKDIDNRYGEQLSALTDGVNDALCGVQILGNKVDDVIEDLAELSGKVETFSADTKEKLDDVYSKLNNKVDKNELDNILQDYPTKEWLNEEGYLTREEGDERYARKETVEALNDRVNSAVTDLNTKIYTVSGNLATFSSTTNARMGVLETNFETLRGEVNRKINTISGTVEDHERRITQNANDIDALEDEMVRKADKADLERLQNTVSNLADVVDTKVGKPEFETYKSYVESQFNDMDDKKADKTALTEINDAIEELDDKIDQEIADRISGDTYITNQITNIYNEINEIKEQAVDYGDRIQTLEDGLAQEILDRQQADLDLIGQETDPYDADTIWGAKNFAKNQKAQAITEANLYTDQEISGLRTEIENKFNEVEQELSGKASKDYVDTAVREAKAELIETLEGEINNEVERATNAEADLRRMILENTRNIQENDQAIDDLSDKVNAITEWDGKEMGDYNSWADAHPSAAGVLDVLHREFHQLIDTLTQKGILP